MTSNDMVLVTKGMWFPNIYDMVKEDCTCAEWDFMDSIIECNKEAGFMLMLNNYSKKHDGYITEFNIKEAVTYYKDEIRKELGM